ncbi:MAG: purine/pyrimidine permease [Spirochaetes bacterium]|nr:purine/pyrimidine permease [Spirochaetota bacterium]
MRGLVLGLQWVVFHAGVIVSAPVVLGAVFQLTPDQTAALMQLSFFITGLGSLLQYLFGHKLSLLEGVAPPWWGAFIGLAIVGTASGKPIEVVRTDIEGGMILAGFLLTVLGFSGIIQKLGKYITPRITGIMLFLFGVQVGGVGIKSLVTKGWMELLLGGLALLFILFLLFRKEMFLSQSAILLGVLVGWAAYLALGVSRKPSLATASVFSLPPLFLWGKPTFDTGTVFSLSILGLLLILNVVGSMKAMEGALGEEVPIRSYDRGLSVTGLTCGIAGITGGIGTIPMAISAGLVSVTGKETPKAFLIASILYMVFGLVVPLGTLLSSIPLSLAGAVLLVSVSSLIAFGVRGMTAEPLGKRESLIVGMGLLIGIGILYLPAEIWKGVPFWARGITSNGVIMGTILTILLEYGILPKKVTVGH